MDLLTQLAEAEFESKELVGPHEIVEHLRRDKPDTVAFDTETTSLRWQDPGTYAFAYMFSWGKRNTYFLKINPDDDREAAEAIRQIFMESERLVGWNIGFDLHFTAKLFRKHDLPMVVRRIEDGMFLHYCLNEQAHHGLKEVATERSIRYRRDQDPEELREAITSWREQMADAEGVSVDRIGYERVPDHLMIPYGVSDAYVTLEAFRQLEIELNKQMETARPDKNDVREIYELEMKCLWVNWAAEERGIRIDREAIAQEIAEISPAIEEGKAKMRDRFGWEVNPGSVEDVAAVLKHLGVDEGLLYNKRSGRAKLPEWVLQDLIDAKFSTDEQREVAKEVLDYRTDTKLLTTYYQPLLRQALIEDGQAIIRCSIKQHGARTGRESITDPPLQTIPVKKGKVRRAFIAREGHKFLICDYSQQELRILAHLMSLIGYDQMSEIYREGGDVHWETAEAVYERPREELDHGYHRAAAKNVNFAIVYGAGVEKLMKMLRADTDSQGRMLLSRYHRRFPGIRKLKAVASANMEKRGYVITPLGRRHRNGPNASWRAVNSLCQGFGADLIKWAKVMVNERFMELGMEAKILLTVHDELIAEAPFDEVELASTLIPEIMCSYELLCPLAAELTVCDSWAEAKG